MVSSFGIQDSATVDLRVTLAAFDQSQQDYFVSDSLLSRKRGRAVRVPFFLLLLLLCAEVRTA